MSQLEAEVIKNRNLLEDFRETWDRLNCRSPASPITYESYSEAVFGSSDTETMRMVIVRENGAPVAIAPFLLIRGGKQYTIGERRLLTLPVRFLRLEGECFVGRTDPDCVRQVLKVLARCNDFHLVRTSEIELHGTLHNALEKGLENSRWRLARPGHKNSIHWFIDLPDTFEEYLSTLSSKARKNRLREIRIFENELGGKVRLVNKVEDVEWFLSAGEKISRSTYQWNIGQRLENNEPTKKTYLAQAGAGILRCHILLAGDTPCAFARGTIRNGVYHYQTPGYDPTYSKYSPGTVLLMKVIQDLIENTDCRVLDFGQGGDMTGYKKVYGNRSFEALSFEIALKQSLYPAFLLALQGLLNTLKRGANALLGEGRLKRAIKRHLRK